MITENDVKHLAELARIDIAPEELPILTKDLQKILDYVEELKAVNTDGLPEVAQVTGLKNITRVDQATPSQATPNELLKGAPATENGYVKVKAVFE